MLKQIDISKVRFIYDNHEALADYLCYLGKQISCGFFQDRRLLVLPEEHNTETRAIVFPRFSYSRQFWKGLSIFTQKDRVFHFADNAPRSFYEAENHIKTTRTHTYIDRVQCIQHEWKRSEHSLFHQLNQFLPKLSIPKISSLTILVSPFGTWGSFYAEKKANNYYDFEIAIRQDFNASQVAEAILSLLYLIQHPTRGNSIKWHLREAIVDFLMTKSSFGELFSSEYILTLSAASPELSQNLVKQSQCYLAELGFPVRSVLSAANGMFFINNTRVLNLFTPTEKRILKNMIRNKNQVVTYDQIAEWFWQEHADERFSLYSIAKIMEKIRRKIKTAGVYPEVIYTVRKEGFVLYD